jgi:hypothetical protein
MGTLFFRMAPYGTYSRLKKRRKYSGTVSHALYMREMVPSFIVDGTDNSRGTLTVFPIERQHLGDENLLGMIFEGTLDSIAPNLAECMKLALNRRLNRSKTKPETLQLDDPFTSLYELHSSDPSMHGILQRLRVEPTEADVLDGMDENDFIAHCEGLTMFADEDDERLLDEVIINKDKSDKNRFDDAAGDGDVDIRDEKIDSGNMVTVINS